MSLPIFQCQVFGKNVHCFILMDYFVFLQKRSAMQILSEKISKDKLKVLAANTFVDMIKCVADVRLGLLAVDAELHADLESLLLENGSQQEDLWGFNLYPDETGDDFVEFDSLINIRAWQGNRSRDVEDETVRQQIRDVVSKYVE